MCIRDRAAPQISEDFDDLVLDPTSPNYVEKRLGKNLGLSMLIEVTHVVGNNTPPPVQGMTPLPGGTDGDNDVAVADYLGRSDPNPLTGQRRSGLAALDEPAFEDVALVYAPNAFAEDGLVDALITHCENNKYRFLI